jgi:hypothetical protein
MSAPPETISESQIRPFESAGEPTLGSAGLLTPAPGTSPLT